MVYQGLLLSERKRLRTESIEEHITPNSAPAQWPGTDNTAFINSQLSSLISQSCIRIGLILLVFLLFYSILYSILDVK